MTHHYPMFVVDDGEPSSFVNKYYTNVSWWVFKICFRLIEMTEYKKPCFYMHHWTNFVHNYTVVCENMPIPVFSEKCLQKELFIVKIIMSTLTSFVHNYYWACSVPCVHLPRAQSKLFVD